MSNKIMLFAAVGGISIATGATGASALPLSPLQSDNSVVEARTVCDIYGRCWAEAYPGKAIRPGASPLFEGRSAQRLSVRSYVSSPHDRTRGRWVTDVPNEIIGSPSQCSCGLASGSPLRHAGADISRLCAHNLVYASKGECYQFLREPS